MAPPKVYDSKKDLHLNVETGIYEIGEFFGLKPAIVLKEGYKFTINQRIEEIGAPTEIKERWSKYLSKDQDELIKRIEHEKILEEKARKEGRQNRISAELRQHVENQFQNFIISDLIPIFSISDVQWLASLAQSSNASVVRQVIPFLRNNYESRTGKKLPIWVHEEEMMILNHLVDIGGA